MRRAALGLSAGGPCSARRPPPSAPPKRLTRSSMAPRVTRDSGMEPVAYCGGGRGGAEVGHSGPSNAPCTGVLLLTGGSREPRAAWGSNARRPAPLPAPARARRRVAWACCSDQLCLKGGRARACCRPTHRSHELRVERALVPVGAGRARAGGSLNGQLARAAERRPLAARSGALVVDGEAGAVGGAAGHAAARPPERADAQDVALGGGAGRGRGKGALVRWEGKRCDVKRLGAWGVWGEGRGVGGREAAAAGAAPLCQGARSLQAPPLPAAASHHLMHHH
jgi:hypothetical protein